MKKNLLILIMLLPFARVLADGFHWDSTINPYVKVQLWNVYSQNFESDGEQLPDRFASYFRRGRVGLKGQLMDRLTYNVMCSFDYLGKSENLSAKGKPNASTLSLWSAYFIYQPVETSQWILLTGGTFLPHLSRESSSSPWTTSSLDKAENSCYLRRFVTGKPNGICPGINLGGLGELGKCQLLYNVSLISRQDNPSFSTEEWSPVFLGHLVFVVGDKEWSSYKYIFSANPLKRKKSLSIGIGGSTHGKTDYYQSSSTYGGDFLLIHGSLKLDGEYYWLKRENTNNYLGCCFHFRGSYNFFLKNSWTLGPAIMYSGFEGDDTFEDASFYDGEDNLLDVGVNLIANKHRIKVSLHYIHRSGESTKNHRVTSSGTYGDYINLGIQLII